MEIAMSNEKGCTCSKLREPLKVRHLGAGEDESDEIFHCNILYECKQCLVIVRDCEMFKRHLSFCSSKGKTESTLLLEEQTALNRDSKFEVEVSHGCNEFDREKIDLEEGNTIDKNDTAMKDRQVPILKKLTKTVMSKENKKKAEPLEVCEVIDLSEDDEDKECDQVQQSFEDIIKMSPFVRLERINLSEYEQKYARVFDVAKFPSSQVIYESSIPNEGGDDLRNMTREKTVKVSKKNPKPKKKRITLNKIKTSLNCSDPSANSLIDQNISREINLAATPSFFKKAIRDISSANSKAARRN